MMRKAIAELIGTAVLVLGGCGTAILSPAVGPLGVSLAFGLSLVAMAYAIGHVSGCHLNPAVTIGLFTAGRVPARAVPVYVVAQVLGAALGAGIIAALLSFQPSIEVDGKWIDQYQIAKLAGFAANGFDEHSPARYTVMSVMLAEFVLTFVFVFVILGTADTGSPIGGLVAGLTLTLVHLISMPISNTSVNPARSTSQALLGPAWAMDQLWVFWVIPLAGAALAGVVHPFISRSRA